MNKHDYGCDYQIAFRKATEADVEQLIDFDCGNPNINFFIRNECLDEKKDVTHLFYDEENDMPTLWNILIESIKPLSDAQTDWSLRAGRGLRLSVCSDRTFCRLVGQMSFNI